MKKKYIVSALTCCVALLSLGMQSCLAVAAGGFLPQLPLPPHRQVMADTQQQAMLVARQRRLNNQQLINGAQTGALQLVQQALQAPIQANVDHANGMQRTALFFAALNGHDQIVTTLLQAGANPNLATQAGETPLYAAAQQGHDNIVRILLQNEAQVDQATFRLQNTPLHSAIIMGHDNIVQMLLYYGADPNRVNAAGETPLQLARQGNHHNIAKSIIIAITRSTRIEP